MSFVKDIADLHIGLRTVLISILFVMPFWYIDIYLFGHTFFVNAPFYVPIVLSFCLAISSLIPTWFFFILGSKTFFLWVTEQPDKHIMNVLRFAGATLLTVIFLISITYLEIGKINFTKFVRELINLEIVAIGINVVFEIGSNIIQNRRNKKAPR